MNKFWMCCLLAFVLFSKPLVAQISSPNLVQEESVMISGVTTVNQLYVLPANQKLTTRQYLDGLGRVIQTVGVGAGPTGKDIIAYSKYNNLGQSLTSYLPYGGANGSGNFRTAAATEQTSFYNNGLSDKVIDDTKPYSAEVVEQSPLQRILYVGEEGDKFQPNTADVNQHYKTISYRSKNSGTYDNYNSGIRVWNADGTSSGTYPTGSLLVSEVTDEAGNLSIVYRDANGRMILKRQVITPKTIDGFTESCLDTYYVYNDVGQIKIILPPKAVAALFHNGASPWNITLAAAASLVYQYNYDTRGRLIQKKVPSSNWLSIVYDPMNRPVLVQDGNLKTGNKWNYIKYDSKGRPVSEGIYTDAVNGASQASMQTYVNGLQASYNTYYFEERTTGTAPVFYTNLVFPKTNQNGSALQDLVYTYYDDYDFNRDGAGVPDYSYQAEGLANEATATAKTRGMATGVYRRTLNNDGTLNVWLLKVLFYDKRGNIIQVKSSNQTNAGVVSDRATSVPDFIGKTLQSKIVKTVNSVTSTIVQTYSYDASNRATSVDQTNNGGASTRVAAYFYNELGNLVNKKLHSTDGINFLQNVDFRYNIRGSLTSINNSTLSVDNTNYTNSDANDLFGEEILYEKTDPGIANTAMFNGNISAIKWEALGSGTNAQRSYRFAYDQLYQLTDAFYKDRAYLSTGAWGNSGINDENTITYDLNGNIKALKRYLSNATTAIDNLTYSYTGNQLTNVTDLGTTAGFNGTTATAYSYDNNSGNLTSDPKKGVTISYNVLNKTDKITFTNGNYLRYTYDGRGELIRKEAFVSSTSTTTTYDYIDGFVYQGNVLSYFPSAAGRVRHAAGSFTFEYFIQDHLGNVRISFDGMGGTAVVRQENSYYPFGMTMPNNQAPGSLENKNLFNEGSELQNDFSGAPNLYQTYYRNYDAVLGRFIAVDPLAEMAEGVTPYQFAYNSPLLFNDPNGDMVPAGGSGGDNDLENQRQYWGGLIPEPSMAGGSLGGGGSSGDYPWSAFLYDLTHGGGGGPSGGGAGPSSGGRSGDPVPKGKTSGGGSTDWNKWKENFQYGVKLFVPGWINSGAALTDLQKGNYVGATIHGLIFAGEWGLIFMTRGRAEQYLVPYHQKLLVQQYLAQAERTVAETGLTNAQLVQKSAILAERAIGGKGPIAGIAKHKYATSLLERYQTLYGHRGLSTNYSFNNGVGNRGILDVFDRANGIIYDFKFGKAFMSPAQYKKYFDNFRLPIQIIRP